jgi:hypothetical protein
VTVLRGPDETGGAHLAAQTLQLNDTSVNSRIDTRREMRELLRVVLAIQPLHDIEVSRTVEGNWVAIKEIWHQREIAIGGELVGYQLCVVEAVADDIGDARCDKNLESESGLGLVVWMIVDNYDDTYIRTP